mmetsp:Transcript_22106/g.53556  ORF Transcript_22106/g.53556 Transcript_22106/m.53556 type:complete len:552 (+) Transcript_22106:329-1984(+)
MQAHLRNEQFHALRHRPRQAVGGDGRIARLLVPRRALRAAVLARRLVRQVQGRRTAARGLGGARRFLGVRRPRHGGDLLVRRAQPHAREPQEQARRAHRGRGHRGGHQRHPPHSLPQEPRGHARQVRAHPQDTGRRRRESPRERRTRGVPASARLSLQQAVQEGGDDLRRYRHHQRVRVRHGPAGALERNPPQRRGHLPPHLVRRGRDVARLHPDRRGRPQGCRVGRRLRPRGTVLEHAPRHGRPSHVGGAHDRRGGRGQPRAALHRRYRARGIPRSDRQGPRFEPRLRRGPVPGSVLRRRAVERPDPRGRHGPGRQVVLPLGGGEPVLHELRGGAGRVRTRGHREGVHPPGNQGAVREGTVSHHGRRRQELDDRVDGRGVLVVSSRGSRTVSARRRGRFGEWDVGTELQDGRRVQSPRGIADAVRTRGHAGRFLQHVLRTGRAGGAQPPAGVGRPGFFVRGRQEGRHFDGRARAVLPHRRGGVRFVHEEEGEAGMVAQVFEERSEGGDGTRFPSRGRFEGTGLHLKRYIYIYHGREMIHARACLKSIECR